MKNISFEEAVRYIEDVPRFTSKNKPECTAELLRRLGNPERSFAVIHVAGTNGKGSVCAFLAQALQDAGFRTGLFTSPHLVRITERFQVNRRIVEDEIFTEAFRLVLQEIDSMTEQGWPHATYFEILFAMGMVIFQEKGIDCLVMETGLGGRLDATNCVGKPVCCVITSIGMDHMAQLGDTIEQIAGEKAGIIKEGIPVVYDAGNKAAGNVIRDMAQRRHAAAFPVYPETVRVTERTDKGIAFVLKNSYYDYEPVRIAFPADYQAYNCALAMTALALISREKLLGEKSEALTGEKIRASMGRMRWSGRVEWIREDVLIDGAHNEDGIRAFLETARCLQTAQGLQTMQDLQTAGDLQTTQGLQPAQDHQTPRGLQPYRKMYLLFAAVSDKDYRRMIRLLCRDGLFAGIVVTQTGGKRREDPEVFARMFREWTDVPVTAAANVKEAYDLALKLKGDGLLLCAGSLYLIGEIRSLDLPEKEDVIGSAGDEKLPGSAGEENHLGSAGEEKHPGSARER